ncbi:hypothetical protein HN784_04460 [bacterium]|jgi:DNA segregation ATPase FtsK/SpoIIIE, S-DNA-T family|nr:hypothetical protein [bacterium]MBT4251426.1 hypothetical protein [bacterium]MBT4597400.1 hypothetical protein [bacterium]MBT6754239.1 hypothetical protein [bacterium]MBT7037565.1 hypothetical protein [bacterium]
MGRKSKKEKEKKEAVLDGGAKKHIIAVFLLMLGLIFLLSLIGKASVAGEYIDKGLAFLFGTGRYLLPVVLFVLGALYFRKMKPIRYTLAALGAVLFFSMLLGLVHIFNNLDEMVQLAKDGEAGGYLGLSIAYPLTKFLGKIAGVIILAGFSLIGLILLFNASIFSLVERIRGKVPLLSKGNVENKETLSQEGEETMPIKQEDDKDVKKNLEDNIKSLEFVEGPKDGVFEDEIVSGNPNASKKDNTGSKQNVYSGIQWRPPSFNLVEKNDKRAPNSNHKEVINIIQQALHNFGIEVSPGEYSVGPTVTQYTFKPAVGVKLSRILSLQDDLALALAASSIRIEAPIPGRSLVGIEVPNKKKSFVKMRTMLESEEFKSRASDISVIWGENVSGKPVLANIEKMPHLMVAGSTGTGKSVCINVLLTTLLFENSPEDLRMILVDPKRVELTLYGGIPHLLTPVIVDSQKVVNALKWAIGEMERRFGLLQEVGSRDIQSFNQKVAEGEKKQVIDKETGEVREEYLEKLPFILIVIDELSDLMSTQGKEVEGLIVRIAQKARAIGIHLVVSTQRPSVEVITGLIKANISTRIAFKVATQIDSRTILDQGGAEKLLGNGDMLYSSADSIQPVRVQGVFISENEVKRVVSAVKKQAEKINYDEGEDLSQSLEEQLSSATGVFSSEGTGGEPDDELYEKAKEIVVKAKKASASMLQRKLRIGFSRAGRIIDLLEENGIVGPADGSRAREILIDGSTLGDGSTEYEDSDKDQGRREKWSA